MKSATATLVALTVFTLFLESSTTKIGARVNIKDGDKQEIYERMESSEAKLAHAIKIAADAMTEATDTEKLSLEACYNFLVALNPTAGSIHEEMRAAIASGIVSDIKEVVGKIDAAVSAINANMNGFNKELAPGVVKDDINKDVNTVTTNAAFCSELMKTYL